MAQSPVAPTRPNADRVARNVLGLDGNGYELFETHSDVGLKYATIDAWAKFKDFAQRYAAAVQKQIGLGPHHDRLERHQCGRHHRPSGQPAAAGREQGLAADCPRTGPRNR